MDTKVLLADDHAVLRDGLRMVLEAQPGITLVGEAEDGRQALEMVEELQPDVVVMDIAMPNMNGAEATRQIKRRFPGVKVLILTMHENQQYLAQIVNAGAIGCVLKRSAGTELVMAVRAAAFGALRAGSPDFTGVAVVCGTGATTGARSASGETWQSSWWQDVQGGRQLGQKALWAVHRAELGIGPPTSLTTSLLETYGVSSVEGLLHLSTQRDRPRPFNPELAGRNLTAHAELRDEVALNIVKQHGKGLAEYALSAARMVGLEREPFPLVLTGGVLNVSHSLRRAVELEVESVAPGVRTVSATFPPVVGALLLSFDQAGVRVTDADLRNLA